MIKNIFEKYPVLKHLIFASLFLLGVILLTLLWLRFYTNHGQKLKMPDFIGMDITKASDLGKKESFMLINDDSVFVVGKPGGVILSQNPKVNAEVKSGRKVYVTTTKHTADIITVSDLPILYGNDYTQKIVELGYNGLSGKIRSRKYDSGEPNHILEVYYKGSLIISNTVFKSNVEINKGDELEFVVSDKESGDRTIPQLICMTLDEAEFLVAGSRLKIGSVTKAADFDESGPQYVISQNPSYNGISKLAMRSPINVTISNIQPSQCDQ